ncbi:transcriptional regulator NrdR [Nanoarchaeota archaeon]
MRCIYCSSPETKVLDSRMADSYVRRRRECLKCSKRFTTYEKAQAELIVIKKDNSKQTFEKNKIKSGLIKACNKRPISEEDINEITNKIENRVLNLNKIEIKSSQIGNIIMKELKKVDPIAYVRFASVCKSFDDITHFEKVLKSFNGGRKNGN